MESVLDRQNETNLPYTTGTVYYCQKTDRPVVQDLVDRENTYKPLEGHSVRIKDARAIRHELDLDKQGFILLDHKSSVSHLRDKVAMEETYNREVSDLLMQISGADLLLPYLQLFVRFSAESAVKTKDETQMPSGEVHLDFTGKSFWDNVGWVQDAAGVERQDYSRVVLYQTWRAVSAPPQDRPLALTDSRSVTPGNYVVMDNIIGPRDVVGNVVETRLACYSEADSWYYFSNMREDELIVFKGYDSDRGDNLNVLHTSFDDTNLTVPAIPRESVESRFFAFWK